MRFLADLHVHSRFSRAVSRSLDLPALYAAAQRKGLTVVGTGDFTHPAWRVELADGLEPAEPGLYALRRDLAEQAERDLPPACRGPVRFVLQAEISTIYKAGDRVRKVHHVVLAPSVEAAARLSAALERVGNLASDGRPILGLDSRDLLEIVLESCPGGCLIPAHLWTPWFSVLGSKSGFDSVDECYRDLADHVFAVETGLSSDPAMNLRLSALDRFALVSSSDAHSAEKLGRECSAFDSELGYDAMLDALRGRDPARFLGTVEFFPEEGKYHLDGHRKCGARLLPSETRAVAGRCPVCGRPVTVGVLHRVEQLADRAPGEGPADPRPGFRRLVGLAELIGHSHARGSETVGVRRVRDALLEALGPELHVLEEADIVDVERVGGEVVAEVLRRARRGEVRWNAGYDGEFGTFEILTAAERRAIGRQLAFFAPAAPVRAPRRRLEAPVAGRPGPRLEAGPASDRGLRRPAPETGVGADAHESDSVLAGLDPAQREAVLAPPGTPLLVVAGPGTGKTRTLVARIAHRLLQGEIEPSAVLALTFTRRAADELRERLAAMVGESPGASVRVSTFHALGLELLGRAGRLRPRIADEPERLVLIAAAAERAGLDRPGRKDALRLAEAISRWKTGVPPGDGENGNVVERLLPLYEDALAAAGCHDLDDLVRSAAEALEGEDGPGLRAGLRAVFVDEYQDLDPGQLRLLLALAGPGVELTAIGDPDQSIYGFRGADPQRLVGFEHDWPGARVVTLGRSFRSAEAILRAASGLIAHAARRPARPRLWSGLDGEPFVSTLSAATEREEADLIALTVDRLLGGTSHHALDSGLVDGAERVRCESLGDLAVLFRLRGQGEPIAEAMARRGLPVETAGRLLLGEDPVAADLVAAVRLVAGRASTADLARASAAGWGPALERLRSQAARASAETLLGAATDALCRGAPREAPVAAIARAARAVDREWARERAGERPAPPRRPIDALVDWIALHGEADLLDRRADRVSLATLHASKGLEWEAVIVAGCEDGLLPYRRPGSAPDLEEERRLLFVGMTRARRVLVLSRARRRTLHGRRAASSPSPFLLELDPALLRGGAGAGTRRRPRPRGRQLGLFQPDDDGRGARG